MLDHLRLENFKSWRELDIQLAPLTLLFGTNSSGKSSILQALLLLSQSAEKTSLREIHFGGSSNDYVNLGSFRDVVFEHDLNQQITIDLEPFGLIGIEYADNKVAFNFDRQLGEWIINFMVIGNLNRKSSLFYLGPIRQYPERSYLWSGSSPRRIEANGENTVAALIDSVRGDGELLYQVAFWLGKMGLVDRFQVAALDEGKRFYETRITIAGVESALLDIGFGVSQVLPVITLLFFAPEGSLILLEQPELHLHPAAQAHLADLFLHVAETRHLQLIVESHSEHLLRRVQRRIAEPEYDFATPDHIRAYFCQKGQNGSMIQPVTVDAYGQIRNWPESFFGDMLGDLDAMTDAGIARRRKELSGD